MNKLAVTLRLYLWVLGISSVSLALYQALVMPHISGSTAMTAIVLFALTLGAYRLQADLGNIISDLSGATVAAAILLLPPPLPLLISAFSMAHVQFGRQRVPYKRIYNITSLALVPGLASAVYTFVAPHGAVLTPPTVLPFAVGVAAMLLTYLVSNMLAVQVAMATEQGHVILFRLSWFLDRAYIALAAAMAWGALGVVVYHVFAPLVILFLLPLVQVRETLTAQEEASQHAEALERQSENLQAIIAAGQSGQLDQTPAAQLVARHADAARAIAGTDRVAAYLASDQEAGAYDLVYPDSDAGYNVPQRMTSETVDMAADGLLWLPLGVVGSVPLGYLRLDGTQTLHSEAMESLTALAGQAYLSVANANAYQRLAQQIKRDGLTGLPNHRGLHEVLQSELGKIYSTTGRLSVILVDLDNFADVNASTDWQIGDTVLLTVGESLRSLRSTGAFVARYGGDEFAILAPNTDQDGARRLAIEARRSVSAIADPRGNGQMLRASVGLTVVGGDVLSSDDVMATARRALRAAQVMGGDRVATEEDADKHLIDLDPSEIVAELALRNMDAMMAFAASVDAKDPYTQGHSTRVAAYVAALARASGYDEVGIARIHLAGLLHDVGKIGVPDVVLQKPDRLTPEEFAEIKKHPAKGEEMLRQLTYIDLSVLPSVRSHHEKWDGTGYPDGLAGLDIHPDAVLMAVADAFDAMTSDRPYRRGMPVQEAIKRIMDGSGTHFSPQAVIAFRRTLDEGTFLLHAVERVNGGRPAARDAG